MARVTPVPAQAMSAAQRALYDRVAGVGRRAGAGPWAALLQVPEIGDPMAGMVEKFMADTRIPQKLKEIAILVIARAYRAQYAWTVHVRRSQRFALEQAAVDAIAAGRAPEFAGAPEQAVHDAAYELAVERRLTDAAYAQLVRALGEEATVELVSLIGFYIAIAVICVAFDVDPPPDAGPPLP